VSFYENKKGFAWFSCNTCVLQVEIIDISGLSYVTGSTHKRTRTQTKNTQMLVCFFPTPFVCWCAINSVFCYVNCIPSNLPLVRSASVNQC